LVDRIPPPEAIVHRLGETIIERRILRALLRAAKLKQQVEQPSTLPDSHEREGVPGA
jgi:hypothetical protein